MVTQRQQSGDDVDGVDQDLRSLRDERDIDLSLLRTCLAVYRAGSLTKAARHLKLSQPAVTGQMRTLERKLDQQLFSRMPHGTIPTDAAHELIRDVAGALDELEAAVCRRLEPKHLSDRPVHLAGPAEAITVRVLPTVAPLVADGLRLRITFGLAQDLLAGLVESRYDMVMATVRPRDSSIAWAPLVDEEFVLVGGGAWVDRVGPADVAARGPEALRGIPLIAYSESLPIIRRYWRTMFGRSPDGIAEVVVPDLRAVLAAVRAGAGISVLPTYLCSGEISRREIAVLHHAEVPPLNTLYLATRTGTPASVGLSSLRSHLLKKAQLWD